MIKQWAIVNKHLSFAALGIGLMSLPFSIIVCHIALIVYLLLWASEGKWNEKLIILKRSILLQLILAYIVLQLAGIAYTENRPEAWFSIEKKIFLFLIPIALATTAVKFTGNQIRLLFYLFTAACFTGIVICIGNAIWQTGLYLHTSATHQNIDYLSSSEFKSLYPTPPTAWMFFSYIGLANGIAIHPTYLSMYLVFCIFFLIHEILTPENSRKGRRIMIGVLILLFSVSVVLLSSRIMVIVLVTGYVVLAAYWLLAKKLFIASAGIVSLLIIISTLLYLNPVSRYRSLQEMERSAFTIHEKTVYKRSAEIRASLWWVAWKSYLQTNPWFGAGTGDVESIMKNTSQEYDVTNILNSHDPHNQYFYILISNGIAGLILFLLWLAIPFVYAWNQQDYLCLAFIFLFATLCITESALELQKGIVFFAVMYSLLTFQRKAFHINAVTLKFFGARN